VRSGASRRLRARPLGTAVVVVALAASSFAARARAGEGEPASQAAKPRVVTHWLRVATWAHILHPDRVHVAPRQRSRVLTRLHYLTEDGFPEVYLVLSLLPTRDRVWVKILLPMRPNGTVGWVPRQALGKLRRVTTWLVVNRRQLDIRFFEHGRPLWRAPVGIGKASTPTPAGFFWVREEFILPDQAFYGPYAFGTSAYASISDWPGGGVVGLHGTSEPQLIPGTPSHGCVRLRNADILWLARHVPVGTPVTIVA
jgi:L,D-transpeptidase catalytic domain